VKIKSKGAKLDFTAIAANVVSRATGGNLFDGTPLPEEPKETEARARGRAGELKRGTARAKKLSPRPLLWVLICVQD
jgi:hypothetical protein